MPIHYRCPVCKKPLTKNEYEKALHIHEAQQKHVQEGRQNLIKDQRAFEAQKKAIKKGAKEEARRAERARTQRVVGAKEKQITKLRDVIKLLKRGKTPQEYGPEFETLLIRRLRSEFSADAINRTPGGRGGDILQVVRENESVAGSIIYECKWTPRISGSHVRQAARAKMSRRAEFAVLVTNGTKRGFVGMAEVGGVFVVHPACVLSMAGLLRHHLLAMLREGIEKKLRAKIANQLLRFIKSPEFRNPMDEVVRTAEGLKDGIKKEFEWHKDNWLERLVAYERIRWDGFAIQENLRLVLHGMKPKEMIQPRERPALPVVSP